ncbi:hypothetical protein ACLOJK_013246 [Asimina triloba]
MNAPNILILALLFAPCQPSRCRRLPLRGERCSLPPEVLVNLTELTHLSFRNNSISGNLADFSANKKLMYLDLSNNKFNGPISPSLVGVPSFASLKLQDNFLTGQIPSFAQRSLREFNVSSNNLTGEIPASPVLRSFYESSYSNNPGLCGPPVANPCPGRQNKKPLVLTHKKKHFLSGSSLTAAFVALDVLVLLLVVVLFLVYYKKMRSNREERVSDQLGRSPLAVVPLVAEERGNISFVGGAEEFELNDLLKASAEALGNGRFGTSFIVVVDGPQPVVVKQLKDLNGLSSSQFGNHMRSLADLKHPNLLPPLAYYYSKEEKLLIYRFLPNGSLFDRIQGSALVRTLRCSIFFITPFVAGGRGKDRIPFKWKSRLSIAQGVARAMAFLHSDASPRRILVPHGHGNLKSTNVLLDKDDTPLVSDYSLSPLLAKHVAVQKMVAYKSPEYQQGKKVSKRADVWSYGCLLLELITGRVPSYSAPTGVKGVDLCRWVNRTIREEWVNRTIREEWTCEIFDAEIVGRRSGPGGMLRLLQIALQCCDKSPKNRPDMDQVARDVHGIDVPADDEDASDYSFTFDSVSNAASFVDGIDRGHPASRILPSDLEL